MFANNGYRPLEAFRGSAQPVQVACLNCGEVSAVLLSNAIRGGSCIHCFRRLRAGRDRALPKSEAIKALASLRLVLTGLYARATLAVAAECMDCGIGTIVKVSDITGGRRQIGCHSCARDAAANEITYCAAGCGRSFGQPLGGPRRKWCSQACMEYFGHHSKPYPKHVGARLCRDCEADITAKQLSAVRCDDCLPAWKNEARRRRWAEDPDLRRRQQADAANRRRARIRGNGRERYERLDVFERDRWRCRLCSFSVDQAAQWPDPLSAAIDHVVPIAAGGPDTLSNVQLAHQGCNWRKSSKDSIGIGPDEFIHPAVVARFLGKKEPGPEASPARHLND
ncbi:HNH endonuclease [Streptomyces bauhiniae]|nr:HNH endonuclease signature motif containing protein [Streptomyces bauhiniae]